MAAVVEPRRASSGLLALRVAGSWSARAACGLPDRKGGKGGGEPVRVALHASSTAQHSSQGDGHVCICMTRRVVGSPLLLRYTLLAHMQALSTCCMALSGVFRGLRGHRIQAPLLPLSRPSFPPFFFFMIQGLPPTGAVAGRILACGRSCPPACCLGMHARRGGHFSVPPLVPKDKQGGGRALVRGGVARGRPPTPRGVLPFLAGWLGPAGGAVERPSSAQEALVP